MELCNDCESLNGHSAAQSCLSGMTLIGIGEREGTLVIEHYHCRRCGTIMQRQFAGDPVEQVWTAIY